MGLLGKISGSDARKKEELKQKMMNSPIADSFENWFREALKEKPFLCRQWNYYDSCRRTVYVDNDDVTIVFTIAEADVRDSAVCNFATTLGYKPLNANGLTYSNGKFPELKDLLIPFTEVILERMKKVLAEQSGEFRFCNIECDYKKDPLHPTAEFLYLVPKNEQKSAF